MDMWGVGCVFFEIVNRAPLFPGLLPPFRLALNNTILLGILMQPVIKHFSEWILIT
jgi:hypothetical protein